MIKRIHLTVLFLLMFRVIIAQSEYTTPQKITIYWDASWSMKDKDLAIEFELLTNYFNTLQDVEVELISFSNAVNSIKNFTIVNADWTSLKSVLLATKYDGVAFYEILSKPSNSEVNLLFTDGIETIDELVVNTKKPTFIVNSSVLANHKLLKKQGIISQGNYINLNEVTIEQSLSLLRVSLKNTPIDYNKISKSPNNLSKKELNNDVIISGVVYGEEGVLENASVSVIGTQIGLVTDDKGIFKIKAKKGDTLFVSHIGMYPKKILINKYGVVNIFLKSSPNSLEEVVVKGKTKINKEVFEDTGYGKINKKKIGYAVQSIGDEDISELITDVASVAQGKFSVSHEGNDISKMVMRGFTSINLNSFPLIIIDGTPIRRTNSADLSFGQNFDSSFGLINFVDPNNVAKITILKGLAATNIYGSEGGNGVFLITTKTATYKNESKGKPYDSAKKRDNNYTENLTLLNTVVNTVYIKELKKLKTLDEVYNQYLVQRQNYVDNLLYFINVSDYVAQWGNKELASKILSNILEIDVNNAALLKLVAYKAEQNYDYLLARKAYEKIHRIRPSDAQSYRDLALIYQETGHYQKSLNVYNDIKVNKIPNTDFSGLQKSINNESRRLVSLHKKELDTEKIQPIYLNSVNYDARIVFDWNDSNAEFELQFVNPQKSFFTWSHTKAKNGVRMDEEKRKGFNSEEFLLIDAPKGEWLINIENKTKKNKKNPVVIKYTVYHNYGKANETKESKTIILNNISKKYMIGKIVI